MPSIIVLAIKSGKNPTKVVKSISWFHNFSIELGSQYQLLDQQWIMGEIISIKCEIELKIEGYKHTLA